ncbi:hypothetical protein CDJ04_07095 [Salmonella enterica]|uniref:Uncharacterized protein n=2 Tax=Salmonella enterica TaxID=28901 RepID=A0A633DG41_SALER|nr:hypothetical protein [Salmonella enterica]EBW2601701.1 hypothetical protein [Salmonella enterica subsp. enterica serovar Poano]EBZ5136763.1 hypothetical protein [Salmonella enterica subsp. enterica serovar Antsalova]ECD6161627.1 hypothetical protein [Salmonella enterica subsp. enterica]ECU7994259.1 hypothetical protein [Salmonella enterica subsp. enterica serovar Toucra]EDX5411661.1 hypothetical protein [Salmonella enterica subsp. enterica serovar Ealing]EHI8598957.1 hypothetical protein [
MWKNKYTFMSEAESDGAPGGDGGAQMDATLLNTGGDQTTNTDTGLDWLPEKFVVTGEDGKPDITASAQKLAQSYGHLEQRFGSGDIPPADIADYKIDAIEGIEIDPNNAETKKFLESAKQHGFTSDQLNFMIKEVYNSIQNYTQQTSSDNRDAASEELKKVWQDDVTFNKNIGLAYRAFNSLADADDKGKIDEIGNNPLVIKLLAKIGAEMKEDSPGGGEQGGEAQTIRDLMKSEAYFNEKHPDHERVTAQIKRYYARQYGNQPMN